MALPGARNPGKPVWSPVDSLGLYSGHEALASVITPVRLIYRHPLQGQSAAAKSIIDELPKPAN